MSGLPGKTRARDEVTRVVQSQKRVLARLGQAALVVAIAYFVITSLRRSWASIQGYAWEVRPEWLVLSAVAFVGFYLTQALGWWFLLRGFEMRSPLPLATATWAKSILARYLPGTVFMFVGRAWMCHAQGLPLDRVSAAMFYEQVLGVCSALVALAVLFPFWEYRPSAMAFALLALPLLIAVLHPRVFVPLANVVLGWLRRPPLAVVLHFRGVVVLLAYYSTTWVFAGAGAWFLGKGTLNLAYGALPVVVAAYALAYVAGMVAFMIPSGIGVREAVLTASLVRFLPAGVALAWALLLRVWVTVIELIFVAVAVALASVSDRWRRK